MTDRSIEHSSFTIERSFKATPEQVFRAFSEPAAKERWFVTADGWPVAEFSHDFRVGGGKRVKFGPPLNRRLVGASRWDENDRQEDSHYEEAVHALHYRCSPRRRYARSFNQWSRAAKRR